MDRITKGYIDNFKSLQELPEDIEESTLFEYFSCYCALSHEYGESFDLADVVTGGGGDSGIDGIAILANNVLISTPEEFDDLLDQNRSISELKFVFIQAKTSASFNGGEIATFGFGVRDTFKEVPELAQNEIIKEKTAIIDHILRNMVSVRNKPSCIMYYITTGQWNDDQNLKSRIEGVKSDLETDNLFSSIEFHPVVANYLQRLYKATIDKIHVEIDLPDKIALPEMEKIDEAYLGILPASQFLNLVSNEEGIIKSILYDNVRDFQGENDVNIEIAETINSDEADKFVVLNNGVTIICKELRNIVRNRFLLGDYQIVNGCQTSHVLYNNREKLSDRVYVVVKIISTTDEDTVNKIVKATNRQTEVTNEQLMALNDFNKQLEAYYQTYTGSERLYYERRSRQYAYSTEIEKVRIVTISTQIKAFASMFLDKPHLASRYYGRLLKDNDGIFDNSHRLLAYYISAFCLYKIEYLIRNKQVDQIYNKYRFHMLMIIKYLVLGKDPQPQLNSHAMERLCQRIQTILNDQTKLQSYVTSACEIIGSQVEDLLTSENAKTLVVVDRIKSEAISRDMN